jgi:type IX secretion system PorP/SprF family membrane protein
MKRLLAITLLLTGYVVNAQQKPVYTQYVLNNYIINPAISGIENYTDLKLSYRKQWVGIEGAPSTFYMTIHGPTVPMPLHSLCPGKIQGGAIIWTSIRRRHRIMG